LINVSTTSSYRTEAVATRHPIYSSLGTQSPDRAVASAGIADHLARFWEKRMRQSLYAYLDSAQDSTLAPLVSEALTRHRERILGKSQ
jgi:formate dehydrogenase subunit delta